MSVVKIERYQRPGPVAFTLLELLVVLAIIGLLAALTAPVLKNFRPNYTASATGQLMDALARGRQLALSQRTTVYMVFVPTNVAGDQAFSVLRGPVTNAAAKLFDKQGIGYNYVTLRSLGDQPGRPTVRYLDSWHALPDGAFIIPQKFTLLSGQSFLIKTNDPASGKFLPAFNVTGFSRSSSGLNSPAIPFPDEDAQPYVYLPNNRPYVQMPYIAWDYMGRLVSGRDEIIPLAKGSVTYSHDANRMPMGRPASFNEQPPGNGTNGITYNVVAIDWITGRAHSFHQEVR